MRQTGWRARLPARWSWRPGCSRWQRPSHVGLWTREEDHRSDCPGLVRVRDDNRPRRESLAISVTCSGMRARLPLTHPQGEQAGYERRGCAFCDFPVFSYRGGRNGERGLELTHFWPRRIRVGCRLSCGLDPSLEQVSEERKSCSGPGKGWFRVVRIRLTAVSPGGSQPRAPPPPLAVRPCSPNRNQRHRSGFSSGGTFMGDSNGTSVTPAAPAIRTPSHVSTRSPCHRDTPTPSTSGRTPVGTRQRGGGRRARNTSNASGPIFPGPANG
jgi:hypothetical protein